MEHFGKIAARALCAAACALALAPAQAHTLVVRIAAQEALEPKWMHEAGRIVGICPDIMAAVERIEPRLHFVGQERSRSLPGIQAGMAQGSLDAACALVDSPQRHDVAQPVGKPVYLARILLAARADDPVKVETVADLVRLGDLVTSQRGSVFTERLKAAGVRVDDATDDNRLNVHKVLAGHGRFAYVNELMLRRFVRVEGLARKVRILPAVLSEQPAYFWVGNKADPALAPLLGAALDRLKASGELERIYARWTDER